MLESNKVAKFRAGFIIVLDSSLILSYTFFKITSAAVIWLPISAIVKDEETVVAAVTMVDMLVYMLVET